MNEKVITLVRRDNFQKLRLETAEAIGRIPDILEEIQQTLYQNAKTQLDEKTKSASVW